MDVCHEGDCNPISPPGVKIRLKCDAPKEVITPFFLIERGSL